MSRDRVVGAHPKSHIWNKRPQFTYSLYNFYGAKTTITGSTWEHPIVKRFSNENFVPSKGGQNGGFRELRGENVKVYSPFTPLRSPTSLKPTIYNNTNMLMTHNCSWLSPQVMCMLKYPLSNLVCHHSKPGSVPIV